MPTKPALLMLSHVPPLPRTSGQRQRVYYSLLALRQHFEVTLCLDSALADPAVLEQVSQLCDEVIVLPPHRRLPWGLERYLRAGVELAYSAATGLKRSNYRLQREFALERVASAVDLARFDVVYFQYWHAAATAAALRARGMFTAVDLHDVLWRSREINLAERCGVPDRYVRSATRRYRAREEQGWRQFDLLIAINDAEGQIIADAIGLDAWYVPMGVPLEEWPDRYEPTSPLHLAYFGAITSRQREREVLRTVRGVMPGVWEHAPHTELRVVGNGPGARVRELEADDRVQVTGYVDDVGAEIGSAVAMICPFVGQYGFRSRLVEILSSGTPIVATPDAVWGMSLGQDDGVFLGVTDEELAMHCVALLHDPDLRAAASVRARAAAKRFGFDETYGLLASRLRAHPAIERVASSDVPSRQGGAR